MGNAPRTLPPHTGTETVRNWAGPASQPQVQDPGHLFADEFRKIQNSLIVVVLQRWRKARKPAIIALGYWSDRL